MSPYSIPYSQKVHFENPRAPPSPHTSASTLTAGSLRSRRDSSNAACSCSFSCSLLPYTPAETIELVSRAGALRAGGGGGGGSGSGNGSGGAHAMMPMRHAAEVFLSAVSAGGLLAVGAAAAVRAQASPWLLAHALGLNGLVGALVFPMGLVWIALMGGELFTDAIMYTVVAVLHRRLKLWQLGMHWIVCFFGNLAGALFVTTIIFGFGGVFETEPFLSTVQAAAIQKQLIPAWHQIFLRGVGCNWLACLACLHGIQGKDLLSKTVGIWWPVFAFTHLGLDHVVANMFYIPMGIFLGTPGLTVVTYIGKGILPVLLGNVIGGGLFVGTYYWYIYLYTNPLLTVEGRPTTSGVERGDMSA